MTACACGWTANSLIDHWTTASPNVLTKDVNVPAGSHVVRVEYFEGVGLASINFNVDRVTSFPDWKGEYFANQFLSGAPAFTRNDVAVSFDWGSNAPAPGIPPANFSVRWTRTVNFAGGSYRFTTRVTGGVALFIDGNLVINQWAQNNNATFSRGSDLELLARTRLRFVTSALPLLLRSGSPINR